MTWLLLIYTKKSNSNTWSSNWGSSSGTVSYIYHTQSMCWGGTGLPGTYWWPPRKLCRNCLPLPPDWTSSLSGLCVLMWYLEIDKDYNTALLGMIKICAFHNFCGTRCTVPTSNIIQQAWIFHADQSTSVILSYCMKNNVTNCPANSMFVCSSK